jgi:hypothetical protein
VTWRVTPRPCCGVRCHGRILAVRGATVRRLLVLDPELKSMLYQPFMNVR